MQVPYTDGEPRYPKPTHKNQYGSMTGNHHSRINDYYASLTDQSHGGFGSKLQFIYQRIHENADVLFKTIFLFVNQSSLTTIPSIIDYRRPHGRFRDLIRCCQNEEGMMARFCELVDLHAKSSSDQLANLLLTTHITLPEDKFFAHLKKIMSQYCHDPKLSIPSEETSDDKCHGLKPGSLIEL